MDSLLTFMKEKRATNMERIRNYCFNRAEKALRCGKASEFQMWNQLALKYGRKYNICRIVA